MNMPVTPNSGVTPVENPVEYQESLESLMFRVLGERAEELDKNVREQARKIKLKNEQLKIANDMMQKARKARGEDGDTEMPDDLKAWMEKNGIKIVGEDGEDLSAEEWDLNISNIQSFIDNLTSTSQMDIINLQAMMDKHSQTFNLLTGFLSKSAKINESIISNIR